MKVHATIAIAAALLVLSGCCGLEGLANIAQPQVQVFSKPAPQADANSMDMLPASPAGLSLGRVTIMDGYYVIDGDESRGVMGDYGRARIIIVQFRSNESARKMVRFYTDKIGSFTGNMKYIGSLSAERPWMEYSVLLVSLIDWPEVQSSLLSDDEPPTPFSLNDTSTLFGGSAGMAWARGNWFFMVEAEGADEALRNQVVDAVGH